MTHAKQNLDASQMEQLAACPILIVEDHPINQMVLKCLLEDLGCCVSVANSGEEALKLYRQEHKILCSDLGLADMSGLELCRQLQQLYPNMNTVIIAMTGRATAQDYEQCLQAGMAAVLVKPILRKQLITTLLECLKSFDGVNNNS